jgi:hypothetical protein
VSYKKPSTPAADVKPGMMNAGLSIADIPSLGLMEDGQSWCCCSVVMNKTDFVDESEAQPAPGTRRHASCLSLESRAHN